MTVTSREIKSPADERAQQRGQGGAGRGAVALLPREYGAVAILFGAPFWVIGAWWSAVGWAAWINALLSWLGLAVRVPPVAGMVGLGAALVIGLAYSRVETRPPRLSRMRAALWLFAMLVWAVTIGTDIGTTFTGATQPPRPEAWAITVWLSANWPAAAVWSAIVTFVPDQLIMRGCRVLWGRPAFGN